MITAPGLYTDAKTRATYHADPCPEPSLSRSIAKLIAERTPRHAFVAHPRLNPQVEDEKEDKFDLGTAAHSLLLKEGSQIEIIDAPDWRTNAAKLARDVARGQGKVPLLEKQYERANRMAEAVRAQLPLFGLGSILDEGASEVVGAWIDPVAGWCRMMIDLLMPDLTIWDIKTTDIAISEENLSRHMSGMGNEWQHAFYERGITALYHELTGRVKFGFIFIETKEPFAVLPVRLSNAAIAKGRSNVERACRLWAHAKETGEWPMFGGQVRTIEYPPWQIAEWAGDVENDV